ncbi:MAG: HEAT repeat domain-containing protein [Elusimicrobia bacterium]|nr:HEAT repeat domain-containing protein [Elusimicrobiota bacterium]
MIYYRKIFLLTGTAVCILFINLFAQSDSVISYVSKANELYEKGEIKKAIISLEDGMAFNPTSVKIRTLLVKMLVEDSKNDYSKKDYDRAIRSLKRAVDLAPTDKYVKDIYEMVIDAKKKAEAAAAERKSRKPAVTGSRMDTKELNKIISSLYSYRESQEEWMESYRKSEEMLNKKIAQFESEKKRYIVLMIISLLLGFSGLGLFIVTQRRYAEREQSLSQRENHLLDLMKREDISFAKSVTKLALSQYSLTDEKISLKEMMVHPNAHIRARGVELLEQELEQKNDPVAATKVLLPFLRDPNNRVRANAAKALYKFNAETAFSILSEMVNNPSRWMQTSAAWALGQILDERSVRILLERLDFLEVHSKRSAVNSLERILKNAKEEISDDLKRTIRKKLKDVVFKEHHEGKERASQDSAGIEGMLNDVLGNMGTEFPVPQNQKLRVHLKNGLSLYKDAKYNEAILEFNDCLKYDNKIEYIFELLGNCYYNKGKVLESIEYYKKELELNPNNERIKNLIDQKKSELIGNNNQG